MTILVPDLRDEGKGWLEKTHIILKRLLLVFHKICEEHKIPYFAIGGTLLGAYRHKGFIPWDGDADVGMMMSDYNKFRQIIEKALPPDIFFQNAETDVYRNSHRLKTIGRNIGLVKLRDRYSCYCDQKAKEHQGVQLDIFLFGKKGRYTLKNVGWPSERPSYNMVFPLKQMPFEDMQLWVPNMTKEFLLMEYPGSLDLPPIAQRHPHEGRVTPYLPCNHPASLKWYNGTLALDLEKHLGNYPNKELLILTIFLNVATICRKDILLYCEKPSSVIQRILDASLRTGEDDVVFPPIKYIKELSDLTSLTQGFKNKVYDAMTQKVEGLTEADNSILDIFNPMLPTKSTPITRFCKDLQTSSDLTKK